MKLVDANVLIYAVNESAVRNEEARAWLDGALNGSETVGFSWLAMLAFVRLTTKVGLFPSPLSPAEAIDHVRDWLSQAPSVVVEPTSRHLEVLAQLLEGVGAGGNLVNDAHLGALALQHRAVVVSYDIDFDRLTGVAWECPG